MVCQSLREVCASYCSRSSLTNKKIACWSCKRKVFISANGKIATCSNQQCSMMQKVTNCPNQWTSIADENNPKEQHFVVINKNMLRKLSTIGGMTLNLDKAEETQIKETLLNLETLKESFDLPAKRCWKLNKQATNSHANNWRSANFQRTEALSIK